MKLTTQHLSLTEKSALVGAAAAVLLCKGALLPWGPLGLLALHAAARCALARRERASTADRAAKAEAFANQWKANSQTRLDEQEARFQARLAALEAELAPLRAERTEWEAQRTRLGELNAALTTQVGALTAEAATLTQAREQSDAAWLKLAAACGRVMDELDRKLTECRAAADPSAAAMAELSYCRLEELLADNGAQEIDAPLFDIQKHIAEPPHRVDPGTPIAEILTPGFQKGERVLRRAKVRVGEVEA